MAALANSALNWSNANSPDRSRNLRLLLILVQRSSAPPVTAIPPNGVPHRPSTAVPRKREGSYDCRSSLSGPAPRRRWHESTPCHDMNHMSLTVAFA
jgi:hypothetical protein